MNEAQPLVLGMLAGEASGDNLGAGLMESLKREAPDRDIRFVGVGGDRMLREGLESLTPMEALSVNGFREPILRLPDLLRIFLALRKEMLARKVDAFIGVDFNVFNFLLERSLKKRGIRTVHYVSPSVYAWRSGRTSRIARSADLLLCLYPFEPAFYTNEAIEAVFVGHPLADAIQAEDSEPAARSNARIPLGVPEDHIVLAVLPGSRRSEVDLLIDDFLEAARLFASKCEQPVTVVIPCPRTDLHALIVEACDRYPELSVKVINQPGRPALTAADVALVKAGTSTLEATLLHCPMVVSYRLGNVSAFFARRLVRTPHVALPNILAGEMLVPELLQEAATPAALAEALGQELGARSERRQRFEQLHESLRGDADANAAKAVLHLLDA